MGTLAACGPTGPAEPEGVQGSLKTQASALGFQISPESPLNPAAVAIAEHDTTVVAAGNGIYLAVWVEGSSAANSLDVLGVRVRASDGVRLDATPIFIGSGSTTQYRPAVAFDGDNFLVVWEQISSYPLVYGARVRASDGAVLDSTPFLISRTNSGGLPLPQFTPAVAFDGTNYLVTWAGYFWEGNSVSQGILGIRVRPSDGTCIEGNSFVISRGEASSPQVAYADADGVYFVAWNRQGIQAARVHAPTGQVMDPVVPLSVAASGAGRPAVAGGSGTTLLVSWKASDNTLSAQEWNAVSGSVVRSWTGLGGTTALSAPAVAHDGSNYWLGWQGQRNGVRQAIVQRLSSGASVPDDAELVLGPVTVSSAIQNLPGSLASVGTGRLLMTYTAHDTAASKSRGQLRQVTEEGTFVSKELAVKPPTSVLPYDAPVGSAAAAGPDISLVVWSEVVGSRPDILGVRVRNSDGARLDATPLRIGTVESSADVYPAVAFDGTNFLVVWSQIGGYPLIYGARVRASDGAVLDSTPFLISNTNSNGQGLPQWNPAVAFDGTNYLVTWDGWYYENGYFTGIQMMRVRPDGTLVDPNSRIIARDGFQARVAGSNGTFLVSWQRNQDVEAARISGASGQVLDTSPISLAATSGAEGYPAVAARSGEFLVTWMAPDTSLWARRISASDGVKLGTADIAIGASALSAPEATFDGQDYRVAWAATRGGAKVLLGTRVSKQGVLEADAERVLSVLRTHPYNRPGIAAWGRGHFLASYEQLTASPNSGPRIYLRLVSDVRPPESCEGQPQLVLNSSPVTTVECGAGRYGDPGAQAFDACGNALDVHAYNTGTDSSGPGPNTAFEGSYTVSYSAWDASGRTVSALRTVNVDDRTAPALQLIGPAFMTHTCGSPWVDPGVQATDACYGDVSPQVWHSGEVNGWAPGTYTVTYSLTDSGGNSATPVTRTVQVANCPW
ncbi:DUF5011 domain-containing protein [Hyalangium minutum]|uniref:DUF5011 domain-containing protein n=1 Tax=Hyalangium minutum TaxID=394096 RepID=UPI001F0A62ED|nr:DUF5011 domain-containing protein [Hyalangium minutum]